MSTCTAALEQELLVGDGWMDGSSEEEEEGKRMGREMSVYVGVCVCECVSVYVWIVGMQGCSLNVGVQLFLLPSMLPFPPLPSPCLNTVI